MPNVLIAGGSGLIGRRLSRLLTASGYTVAWLSRRPLETTRSFRWSVADKYLDPEAIRFADYLIQLAGYNLAGGRWTRKRKKEILDSRVETTRVLSRAMAGKPGGLKGYFAASAVGFYGSAATGGILTEEDPCGSDFLADVCRQWELSSHLFQGISERLIILRTGVVLAREGGAFPAMSRSFPYRIGIIFGSGNQFFPWIHVDDLCGIYLYALQQTELRGIFNAVSPEFLTHRKFMNVLAESFLHPIWLPSVPSFLLRLALGEMSSMLLEGNRVSAEKIRAAGYRFLYPDLKPALADLIEGR